MRCADFGPMPGQPAELVDQVLDRPGVDSATVRSPPRRPPRPPGPPPSTSPSPASGLASDLERRRPADARRAARRARGPRASTSSGSTAAGIDRDTDGTSKPPVTVDRHHATARRPPRPRSRRAPPGPRPSAAASSWAICQQAPEVEAAAEPTAARAANGLSRPEVSPSSSTSSAAGPRRRGLGTVRRRPGRARCSCR